MIISKSNIIKNSPISIDVGSLSSGSIEDILNPDFSLPITATVETLTFILDNVGECNYVALHGLDIPLGCGIQVINGDSTSNYIINNFKGGKNLVFYFETPFTGGDLTITLSAVGPKTVSYCQAGMSSKISWGVNSGQSLYYFGKTSRERVTTNQRGVPTNRVVEEVSPTLSINIRNMPKDWARTDLQEIITHYNECGILSILDYETEIRPHESVAGFDLRTMAPKAHDSTISLVNITMSMKVSV